MANNIIIIPLNLILVFSGLVHTHNMHTYTLFVRTYVFLSFFFLLQLLLPPSIPKWFYWAHYGSYVRYAVDGLVKNQFKNLPLRYKMCCYVFPNLLSLHLQGAIDLILALSAKVLS